jgi:hypothetical protein
LKLNVLLSKYYTVEELSRFQRGSRLYVRNATKSRLVAKKEKGANKRDKNRSDYITKRIRVLSAKLQHLTEVGTRIACAQINPACAADSFLPHDELVDHDGILLPISEQHPTEFSVKQVVRLFSQLHAIAHLLAAKRCGCRGSGRREAIRYKGICRDEQRHLANARRTWFIPAWHAGLTRYRYKR